MKKPNLKKKLSEQIQRAKLVANLISDYVTQLKINTSKAKK